MLVAVWEPLGIPQISVTYLIIILLIGFPAYILILWKTRINHSISEELDEDFADPGFKRNFKKIYFSSVGVISVICVLSVSLIVSKTILPNNKVLFELDDSKTIVMNFENNTGELELDVVGKMTADWLLHNINEYVGGQVITNQVVNQYASFLNLDIDFDNSNDLLEQFDSKQLISGSYFLENKNLTFKCTIFNKEGQSQFTLTSECDKSSPMECIKKLNQRLLGYLVKVETINSDLITDPPIYDAYVVFMEARKHVGDYKKYNKLLDEVLAIDSTWFEPLVQKIENYYNSGQIKIADSLINQLGNSKGLTKRQQNRIDLYRSLIEGENDKIYRYLKYEYDIDPYDLDTSTSLMVIMLQFINKPEEIEGIYNFIDTKSKCTTKSHRCINRYWTMGYTFIQLKQYDKTISLLEPIIDEIDDLATRKVLARAYAELDQRDKIDNMVRRLELKSTNQANDLKLSLASTYLSNENIDYAMNYLNSVIQSEDPSDWHLAKAYYLLGDFKKALNTYEKLYNSRKSARTASEYAIALFQNGKVNEANTLINSMEEFREAYDYGSVDYNYARYFAVSGQKDKMFEYLLKSISKGQFYTSNTFQNDPIFQEYYSYPLFKEVLTFWH